MSEKRGHLTQKQKAEVCLRQKGKCAMCDARLIRGLFQFDHTQDLQFDGDNEIDNWQALCTKPCHGLKTKLASKAAAKADRIFVGGKERKWRPMAGTKRSGLQKKMSGAVLRRA